MQVLLAIPSYNCEQQIGRVVKSLASFRPALSNQIARVIIFDNRSHDGTIASATAAVRQFQIEDWISVALNEENYGLGGTHKVALSWAIENKFSHVIVFHGDNQGAVEDIPRVLELFHEENQLALGSRFMSGARREGYSKIRTIGNRVLNVIFTCLTGRDIKDLGSGLNGINLDVFESSEYLEFSNSFAFNVDLLLFAIRRRQRICFFPIVWREFDQISNAKNVRVAISMLASLLRWRFADSKQVTKKAIFRTEFVKLNHV